MPRARTRYSARLEVMPRTFTRREFFEGATGLAVAAGASPLIGCRAGRSTPNLLLVTIEDWQAAAAGGYGSSVVKTPQFDAFAASGVRFDRAYCQSSICGPSRASFLTGMRPDATGVYKNPDPFDQLVSPDILSIPEYFRAAGAYTANIGKLFHGVSERLNAYDRLELFDVPRGYAGQHAMGRPAQERTGDESDDDGSEGFADRRAYFARAGDSGESEEESPDGQRARLAAEILRERAREGGQFLLSVGFQRPHLPFLVPRKFLDLYDPGDLVSASAPPARDRGIPDAAKRWGVNYGPFAGGPPSDDAAREVIATYFACVSFMDAQLGVVLDALEETGLARDTVVVVFADHGFHLGEHGLWGKETLFEQATRVPLAVRVPGAAGNGRACSAIVELVDVVPTILDLCGIERPAHLNGEGFAPLLQQPEQSWKQAAFSVCSRSREIVGRSVRSDRYRWSIWTRLDGGHEFELYDLAEDPWEHVNVAGEEAYREIAREHAQIFREHRATSSG